MKRFIVIALAIMAFCACEKAPESLQGKWVNYYQGAHCVEFTSYEDCVFYTINDDMVYDGNLQQGKYKKSGNRIEFETWDEDYKITAKLGERYEVYELTSAKIESRVMICTWKDADHGEKSKEWTFFRL
jgi:hypothetical protein